MCLVSAFKLISRKMFKITRDYFASFDSKRRNKLLTSAFHVVFPFVLSYFLFPALIWVAALNVFSTYLVFVFFTCIYFYAKRICKLWYLAPRYFFAWTLTSVVYLWFATEDVMTAILPKEYEVFIWSTFLAVFSFYTTRYLGIDDTELDPEQNRPKQYTLLTSDTDVLISGNEDEENQTEKVCVQESQPKRPNRDWDRYCIWLDCPINSANRKFFILSLLLTVFALYYGLNLTILKVCRPIIWFSISDFNFLLPHNCQGAYLDMDTSKYSAKCIYACMLAIGCCISFVKQLYACRRR